MDVSAMDKKQLMSDLKTMIEQLKNHQKPKKIENIAIICSASMKTMLQIAGFPIEDYIFYTNYISEDENRIWIIPIELCAPLKLEFK